jgi:hypothetical protein
MHLVGSLAGTLGFPEPGVAFITTNYAIDPRGKMPIAVGVSPVRGFE